MVVVGGPTGVVLAALADQFSGDDLGPLRVNELCGVVFIRFRQIV